MKVLGCIGIVFLMLCYNITIFKKGGDYETFGSFTVNFYSNSASAS